MTAITGTGLQAPAAIQWSAYKYGLKAWSMPVDATSTTASLTLGRLYVTRSVLPLAATISTISYRVVTGATTPTSGQCFVLLYSSAGSLLAQSADISGSLASSTVYNIALTSPYVAAADDYYIGIYVNAVASPTFTSSASNGLINFGLSVPSARSMNCNSGLTTTPPSSLSNHATTTSIIWFGLS